MPQLLTTRQTTVLNIADGVLDTSRVYAWAKLRICAWCPTPGGGVKVEPSLLRLPPKQPAQGCNVHVPPSRHIIQSSSMFGIFGQLN